MTSCITDWRRSRRWKDLLLMPRASDNRDCLLPAFDGHHYVPVLSARAAELGAAEALPTLESVSMSPIWVIPPITTDPKTGERKKTREQHLAGVAKALIKAWGTEPAFVDTHQYCDSEGNDRGLATSTLSALEGAGLRLVPVLRDGLPAYVQEEIAAFAAGRNRDICIRLSAITWADFGTPTGDAAFADLVRTAGAPIGSMHLIIDVADQVSNPPKLSAVAVRGAMAALDRIDEWRSLTLLSTAMPPTTAEVGKNNVAELPRSDWGMWKLIREGRGRRMSFGDYAVQSVDILSTFNPLYMQASAQLRYTISNSWFVARGSSTRTGGFAQSSELAARITQHSEFAGRDFSGGDRWIADRAVNATGTGNATTWRMVATNHHLAFVIRQLANLRGS